MPGGPERHDMDPRDVERRFKSISAFGQFDRIEEDALAAHAAENPDSKRIADPEPTMKTSPVKDSDLKRPLPDEVEWGTPDSEHGTGQL